MNRPARIDTYDEPEQLAAAIPGMRISATPLAKGTFRTRIATWSLDGVVFQAGACSPLAIEFTVGAEFAALQVPLLNRQALRLNGRLATRHAVGLYGGGAELLRSNPLSATYGTLVLPMQSAEVLLCPPAGAALVQPGAHGMLESGRVAWQRMAGMINEAVRISIAAPAALEAPGARAGLRASLLHAARDVLARGDDRETARRLNARRGWLRIVKGAEAHLAAHPGRAIYTEDLCAALAVSPASLAEAFHQVLGTTPHRFLKQRRLSMVRSALRAAEGPCMLVKSVALDHGFWHLGQFALDYRARYGETPSETLARARCQG